MHHCVEHLGVAHAVAEAGLGKQVWSLGHRLHARGDAHLQVAGTDCVVDGHGGTQPRGTDLVDGLAGDLLGDTPLDLRLARRNLSLSGLKHLTHDHVVDLRTVNAGALQGLGDRHAAQVGGVEG